MSLWLARELGGLWPVVVRCFAQTLGLARRGCVSTANSDELMYVTLVEHGMAHSAVSRRVYRRTMTMAGIDYCESTVWFAHLRCHRAVSVCSAQF